MMKSNATVYVLCFLAPAVFTDRVQAGRFDELLEAVARGGRHVDDVPGPRMFGKLDDVPKMELPAVPEDELLRRFNRLDGVDDSMRRRFLALPPHQQAALIELGEAAQRIMRNGAVDEGMDLLRMLDVDGLAQARTYGNSVVDGVQEFGPEYKSVVRKMGRGAGTFYDDWVRPHKGKWAAGTLAAAYLAAPEKFHNKIGDLTRHGTEQLTEAGIIIGAAFFEGIWLGLTSRFRESAVFSTLGLSLLIGGGLLLVPRVRWLVFHRLLGPLWRAPVEPKDRAAEMARNRAAEIEKHRAQLKAQGLQPEDIERELRKKFADYGGERKSHDGSPSALQHQPERFEE